LPSWGINININIIIIIIITELLLDCVLWLGRKKLPAKQDSVECCLIDMFS